MSAAAVFLKRVVDSSIKPFLVIAGIATMLLGLVAFFPEHIVTNSLKLEYIESYALIIRHWGMLVLLLGVFLVLAAFYTRFRNAILWYSTLEKGFFVYLYFQYRQYSFAEGFFPAVVVDGTIAVCTLFYFFTYYFIQNGTSGENS